jgi:hypothetical protein
MAGPYQEIEAPDGSIIQFPANMPDAEIEAIMRREYPAKKAPAAPAQPAGPFLQRAAGMLPAGTQPVFPAGAMATPPTGKEAALDARNQQISERQDLAGKAMMAAQGAQDARLEPVKAAGKTAAGAAMSDFSAGFETPKPNMLQSWLASGPQEMGVNRPVESAGIAAEREVFNKAGVMMPDVAAGSRLINSAALGLPAILNKDFRKTVVQAEEDQPGMALFGDLLGYAAPGSLVEAGLQGVSKAAAPLISRFTPKGGSALERGTRVTGRAVGLAGSGATQSGVYQGTVGESIAAGKEDRAPSLAGAAEGLKTGVTDPFALLTLPAALGANRLLTYIASGGATATPANIAGQIDQMTGRLLNPRRAIGQTLDMDVAGADIRPQAMDRIIRELESAGLTVEDISRLMESVQQRLGSLPEAQAGRLTLGQALAEATARDRPQALPTIMATLRERRLSGRKGDKSAGIISGVTQDLERTQIDYLSDSISRNIGDTTLPEVDEQIAAARREISNQYNQVLAQADPTRPEARGLAMIVAGDKSKGVLSRRATNAGFENVDAYIAARPDDAAHWLRSRLAKDGRTAQGREKGELETTVAQLDELLETNEGYRQARMQWGHEAGLEEAQDWAKNFTNIARDEGAVADLLAELNRMPEAQRNVAMSSLRNEVLKSVRGGPEDAAVRLSKWMTRGALDALEQLGEGGQALANDLRFLNREQRWLFKVDPETLSPTAVRLLSAQTAQEAGNAPLSSMMTGAGQPGSFAQDVFISAAAGQPLPIMTVQRGLQRASDAIFRPRTETLQDVARLYMGRSGNIPTPTERPDFTPLFNRGTPPVIPPPGGAPPAGGTPPQAPAPRTVGVAPATAAMPTPAPVPPVPTPPPTPSPLATEWQQVMPQIGAARQVAGDLRDAAATARSPDQIADVQTQLMLLRQQLQEVMTARGAGQTAEDLRLQEIIDALSVGGQDPRYLSALAEEVANDLNAITQAVSPARTVGVAPPTRTSGLGIGPNAQATLQQSAFGSLGGSAYGSQNDVNGDGVIDEQDAYAGAFAGGVGLPLAAQGVRTVGQPRATSGRTVGAGLGDNPYFGRQSMRPPGSGPSAREIETQQQWATATPIVTQARTTAQSAQQAADAALQSKAPADIARAKDAKKTLVGQLQEAQASRAGMDTPEDARLAETLASLTENTSDPVLLSTQISAAKTSLDRLLTDIGSPVEGNLIPVRTNILTRTQAPRSAAVGPQDRASVTRYAEGEAPPVKGMGFGAETPKSPQQAVRFETDKVIAPTDDVQEVISSNFYSGKVVGNRDVPIEQLKGGVMLDDPKEAARVAKLAEKMSGPDGFFSRIIVDENGNVLEGQHRLEAMRQLGAETVPAVVVRDNFDGLDVMSVRDALASKTKIHKDQALSVLEQAQEMLAELGSSAAVKREYDFPKGFESSFDEALKLLETGAQPPLKPMGFGAGTPKTPEQAVRFETPGSPEYEAAVAKGLDMSQAGRMGRRKSWQDELGTDQETAETIFYRGRTDAADSFEARTLKGWEQDGTGVSLDRSPSVASGYANQRAASLDGQNVVPVYVRGKLLPSAQWEARVSEIARGSTDPQSVAAAAKQAQKEFSGQGYAGVKRPVASMGQGKKTGEVRIFDPSNIRSVNAAFDPKKSGSSTLLAAAPFAAVGGAGLTLAGEDARNQRTVGKPKASQSARTVGKAKTN